MSTRKSPIKWREDIANLLRELKFHKVVYAGPVSMLGSDEVLFYDADFYDIEDPNFTFNPRQFRYRTKMARKMRQVVQIFVDNKARKGSVVKV